MAVVLEKNARSNKADEVNETSYADGLVGLVGVTPIFFNTKFYSAIFLTMILSSPILLAYFQKTG